MYKLHLILKYLRKRRIAWVSLIAVMLCTAMVLVVISVMGGWLRMFRESFRGLGGDVIVSGRLQGFPHYEEMARRIEGLPDVEAAVPTLQTFGLVNINNVIHEGVQVLGLPLDRIGQVNTFPQSLYRQHQRYEEARRTLASGAATPEEKAQAQRLLELEPPPDRPTFDPLPDVPYELIRPNSRNWPGMVVGAGVVGIRKNKEGKVERPGILYESWANLVVLGVDPTRRLDVEKNKADRTYWIVDDSRTQIWQYDSNTVYVPFDVLQQDLGMAGDTWTDAETGEQVVEPARTSELQVKVRPGADLAAVKQQVERIVAEVQLSQEMPAYYPVSVQTWEETQATWLGAVEKEKTLVTFLFAMISVVAVFLIFCIFYMIVVEKTKDIGIVKSVGASSGGVAGIFLGYGMAIGLLGGGLGLGAAYLIVRYINEIHDWLGRRIGVQVWNPEVYAFDKIPNTMDPKEVAVIVAVAVLSSVLGALVPALRAARMNPVEALRWE